MIETYNYRYIVAGKTGVVPATHIRKFSTSLHWRLKSVLAGALGIITLALPWSVQAQKPQGKKTSPPAAGQKANVSAGRALFVQNCSPCHGANGQGGEGPNLQIRSLTDAAIRTAIQKGIKGEMPAFGSKFKEADIKALAAFLHSIKKSP